MNFSGAESRHHGFAQKLQYERVAVFEAVLALRDQRNRMRTKLIGWSAAIATVAAAITVCL